MVVRPSLHSQTFRSCHNPNPTDFSVLPRCMAVDAATRGQVNNDVTKRYTPYAKYHYALARTRVGATCHLPFLLKSMENSEESKVVKCRVNFHITFTATQKGKIKKELTQS